MRKILFLAAIVIIVDQISKYLVMSTMTVHQSHALIKNVIHITYVRNPGAAFGILPNQRLFFIVVTIAVVFLLIMYARQASTNLLLQTAFGLQLGGAVGNLIDRIVHTVVIDFIDFRFWPVFNVSDAAIVIGVGLFALDIILDWAKTRHAGHES